MPAAPFFQPLLDGAVLRFSICALIDRYCTLSGGNSDSDRTHNSRAAPRSPRTVAACACAASDSNSLACVRPWHNGQLSADSSMGAPQSEQATVVTNTVL